MKKTKIAIVVSKFNSEYTGSLLSCAQDELKRHGIASSQIKVVWVPGAYELPFIVHKLAQSKSFAAVIALGCVIKGETSHDMHVAGWAATGVGIASLMTGVPCLFGVLTPNNEAQAKKRSRPGPLNRGKEVAEAAVEMIKLQSSVWRGK